MYDINDEKFNKINPTEENLLEKVTDYEIFSYYAGEFQENIPFCSPLEHDDNPSFGIFASRKYPGRLLFKDHRGPSGGSIYFVQLLHHLSYKEALNRIIIDFELQDHFHILDTDMKQLKPVKIRLSESERKEVVVKNPDVKIRSRKWKRHDINYWKKQGISRTTLDLFNVVPIDLYWCYGKMHNADKFAYAYKEYKDGILNYKIYQPYRQTKDHKFVSGFLDGTFSGWNLLPDESNLIIITKSAKDTMFLYEHGFHAISPQGEGYTLKPQVMDILKSKYKRIITFYDHDETGIRAAERNRKEFGFEFVTTCDNNVKDVTDMYKKYGLTETLELINLIFK